MKNNITAFTYSDKTFIDFKVRNKLSAINIGKVKNFYDFGPDDIDIEFYKQHKEILNQKKGAGFWLWKPYFFCLLLEKIQENDILIYTDAASYFVKDISHIITYFNVIDQDIMCFDLPLQSNQWTKEETFFLMNASKVERESNQISASFIIAKKKPNIVSFSKLWLKFCCNIELISDTIYNPKYSNPSIFISHRFDQSILSILYIQHGFKSFRDPSQYGFLTWEYIISKKVIYRPNINYDKDKYPTIFFHSRNIRNIKLFHFKTRIKLFLAKFSTYRNWEIQRRQY